MSKTGRDVVFALLAFAAAACVHHVHVPDWSPPSRTSCVIVTVVDAEIEPRKPTGDPWDPPEQADSSGLAGFLAAGTMLCIGAQPELAMLGGKAFSSASRAPKADSAPAPDPFVRLECGRSRVVTPVELKTVLPNWDCRMLVDPSEDAYVKVFVVDADYDPVKRTLLEDPIGTLIVPTKDLLSVGLHRLGPFESVKRLDVRVEPCSDRLRQRQAGLVVDGTRSWTSSSIDVIQGQTVRIAAGGSVSPDGGAWTGPEGVALPRWQGYSELHNHPHCGLLVRVGADGPPMFVGRGGSFVAGGSGRLFFGPNDRDLGNNAGQFVVDVETW